MSDDDEIRIADAAIGDDFSLQELLESAKRNLLEDVEVDLDKNKIGMNMVGLVFPSAIEVPIEVFNAIKTTMEMTCTRMIEEAVGYGVPIAGFQAQHLATGTPPVDIVDR